MPRVIAGVLVVACFMTACSSISRHTYFTPAAEPGDALSHRTKNDVDFHLSGPPDLVEVELGGTTARVTVASFSPRMVMWGPVALPVLPVFPITLLRDRHFRADRFDGAVQDSSLVVLVEAPKGHVAALEAALDGARLEDPDSGRAVTCPEARSVRSDSGDRDAWELEFPIAPDGLRHCTLRLGDRTVGFTRTAGWRFETKVD